jgi:hypothetical protein
MRVWLRIWVVVVVVVVVVAAVVVALLLQLLRSVAATTVVTAGGFPLPQARVRARSREARCRDARRLRAESEEKGSRVHAGSGGAPPGNPAIAAGQASPRHRGRQSGNRVGSKWVPRARTCACFGEQVGPRVRLCAQLCGQASTCGVMCKVV